MKEVDSSNVATGQESTDHRNLNVQSLAPAETIRHRAEHLFAGPAAIIFAQATEHADLDVIDLDFWDNATCTLELKRTNLGTTVVRNARFYSDSADKVLSNHEDRLTDLMVACLRVSDSLLSKHKKCVKQFIKVLTMRLTSAAVKVKVPKRGMLTPLPFTNYLAM